MDNDIRTARNGIADLIRRAEGPLADGPADEASTCVRAARVVSVAFDGSPAGRDALALSALLASSTGSQLLVVCAFPWQTLAGVPFDSRVTRIAKGDYRIFVRQDAEAALREAQAILPSDLAVTYRALECRSALHGLRDLAVSEDVDVLVVGSTRRGLLGRLSHRSVARGLVRAPCSLIVVAGHPRHRPDPFPVSLNAWLTGARRSAERSSGTRRIGRV